MGLLGKGERIRPTLIQTLIALACRFMQIVDKWSRTKANEETFFPTKLDLEKIFIFLLGQKYQNLF